ncbi:protein translocase subunit SecF [Nitriliruptor alkaliphilus]|uniref:protein translocase subunit SecF n=1 Tax=Nitriliruptor alkaliphilus TaxID=427918 RepID=UPI0006985B2D|nr:protein translocase subunit SecF [Nitriliruptor alkaliphilus]
MKTTTFDFVGKARTWVVLSASLLLLSIGSLVIGGLDMSIEFVGGTSYRLEGIQGDVSGDDLRAAAEGAGAHDVTAQLEGDPDAPTAAIIRTAALEPGSDEAVEVETALTELAEPVDVQFEFVGPRWGQRLTTQALRALVVFLVVVVIYISMRLEPKMAAASVLALTHDVLITIGLYALVGFTVSPATVIALLTILGYSLYDTVVVFDRVKENDPFLGEPGFRTYGQLVNTSMNEVLWRSINTSITSLLPVGALLLIGSQLLGATTLQDLALALFIGMAVGIYSSLFVAGPFFAWLKSREPESAKRAAKVSRQLSSERLRLGAFEAPVPEADPTTALGVDEQVLAGVVADEGRAGKASADADEAPAVTGVAGPASRAPVTTEYVRGRGKQKRSKRKGR